MKRRGGHYTQALFVALAVFVGAGLAAALAVTRDPVASLRLDVAEIRARTAELAILTGATERGRTYETFRRAMALQLARQLDSALHAVRAARRAAPSESERAEMIGRDVASLASTLAHERVVPTDGPGRLARAGEELDRVIRALGGP